MTSLDVEIRGLDLDYRIFIATAAMSGKRPVLNVKPLSRARLVPSPQPAPHPTAPQAEESFRSDLSLLLTS